MPSPDEIISALGKPPVPQDKDPLGELLRLTAPELPPPERKPKSTAPQAPGPDDLYDVERVIDGDTIQVSGVGRVRLLGLNTPETVDPRTGVQPGGPEASDFMKHLMSGRKVRLKFGPEDKDAYGRRLACVHFEEGGEDICTSSLMLDAKFGKEIAGKLPHGPQHPSPDAMMRLVPKGGSDQHLSPPPDSGRAPGGPSKVGDLSTGLIQSSTLGFVRGVLSPFGMLFPQTMKTMTAAENEARKKIEGYVTSDEGVRLLGNNPHTQTAVELTHALPEIAGTFAVGGPVAKATHALTAAKISNPALRVLVNSAVNTSAFTAFAEIKEGESRESKIASTMLTFGAIDLALGMFDKGVRKELGEGYDRLVSGVSKRLNRPVEQVQQDVALLRAGAGTAPKETAVAEAVNHVASTDPAVRGTPVAVNALQRIENMMQRVLPKTQVEDPLLRMNDKNFGVQFDLMLGDKKLKTVNIRSNPDSPQQFASELNTIRQTIISSWEQGAPVTIDNLRTGSPGTTSRFRNFMMGKDRFGNPSKPPIPGAAPVNTAAEAGTYPAVGTTVKVNTPSGPSERPVIPPPAAPTPPTNPSRRLFFRKLAGAAMAAKLAPEALTPAVSAAAKVATTAGLDYAALYKTIRGKIPSSFSLKYPNLTTDFAASLEGEVFSDRQLLQFANGTGADLTAHLLDFAKGFDDDFIRAGLTDLAGYSRGFSTEVAQIKGLPGALIGETDDALRKLVQNGSPEERKAAIAEIGKRSRAKNKAARAGREPDPSRSEVPPQGGTQGEAPAGVGEAQQSGGVWTRKPDGSPEWVPLSNIRVSLPQVGQTLEVKPHSDGTPRHFLIHTEEKDYASQLSSEAFDAPGNPDVNSFRGDFFYRNDPDANYGNDVRAFFSHDGVTLSVTPGERVFERTQFGPVGDFGWQDSVEHMRAQQNIKGRDPFTEPGFAAEERTVVQRRKVETVNPKTGLKEVAYVTEPVTPEVQERYALHVAGAPPPSQDKRFKPPAGFTPRAQRVTQYNKNYKAQGGLEVRSTPVQENVVFERTRPKTSEGDLVVRKRLTEGGVTQEVMAGEPFRVPVRITAYPPNYSITPDMIGHPELVTAQKAARILIRRGVSGDTPVAVRAAFDRHRSWSDLPWTLKELADAPHGLVDLPTLRAEAEPRGLRVIPLEGTRMKVVGEGWERTFDSGLAAAEFVTRQPGQGASRILEDPIEAQLGLGRTRTMDPGKDVASWAPAQLQEVFANQLVQGKRPLAVLHSERPDRVQAAIQALEELHGLPKGRLQAFSTPVKGIDKPAVVVYDPIQVKQSLLNPHMKDGLARLGISANAPTETVLRQLAARWHGLDAFSGAPEGPASALHYTWLREHGLQEGWVNTPLVNDAFGTRRIYSPDEILLARRGGPGSVFAGGEPPLNDGTRDLRDLVQGFPEGTRMYPPANAPMFEPESLDAIRHLDPLSPEYFEARRKLGFIPESGVGGLVAGRWLRVREELFKDWQRNSGVPYWDLYKSVADGRLRVDTAFGPLQMNMYELFEGAPRALRENAQLVFDAHATGRGLSELQQSATPQALQLGEASFNLFKRWLTERVQAHGGTAEDVEEFLRHLPQVRRSGGNFTEYQTNQGMPKIMTLLSKAFVRGDVVLDEREMDLRKNLIRIGRALVNQQELAPAVRTAEGMITAYQKAGMVSQDNWRHFTRFLSETIHQPDHIAISLARAMGQVTERLAGRKLLDDTDTSDIVSVLSGFNWFANGAYNPGLVMRNMLSTLQTSIGLGTGPWAAGVKQALKWARDTTGKFEDELVAKGVLTRDLESQRWGDIQEVGDRIRDMQVGGLNVGQKYYDALKWGVKGFRKADDWNRIVAYYAQHTKAQAALPAYRRSKDFAKFIEDSMIDMRDAKDGPLIRSIREALESGEEDVALHMASMDYMRATQFEYRRGTGPYWMQSTTGRFLGQYGTWPSYFAELGRNTLLRGSAKNRLKVIGRWAGANTAMYTVASEVFGVDAGRWLFFSPLGYTGGPFAEIAGQGLSAVNQAVSPSDDPVAKMQTQRLQSAWQQFVPAPVGAVKNTLQAIDQIQNGSYNDGLKRFLGFPIAKQ